MQQTADRPITGRARSLLEALRKRGDWMTRADLAAATGKARLSPHDIGLIERLIGAGLVELRRRPSTGPNDWTDYRVTEQGGHGASD